MMKTQRLLVVFTIANSALLLLSLSEPAHKAAANDGVAPVLRARAFEIVDDHGRVRAEIKVLPAQPTLKMPDGTTGYPETVQLRLFSSTGGPNVKLGATEDGSGLVLGGESGSYVQILSRGRSPFLKILNDKEGRQQMIKP